MTLNKKSSITKTTTGNRGSMTTGVGVRQCGAALVLALAGICFAALPASAQANAQGNAQANARGAACTAPSEFAGLEHAPDNIRHRVARKLPIKIVAIGSSSTSGAGASSQAATYPSRLEAELKARLPGLPITVLNKGIGGEEAAQ